MKEFLHHFFIARPSNNHRPKLLHHQSILFFIAILIFLQGSMVFVKRNYEGVLGTSTSITSEKLLEVTNKKRQELGFAPLSLNQELSSAAYLKSQHMFAHNYWAHNGPDGTTPWEFFNKVGYEYRYAGENLARGFTTSEDVVNAWMASPTHRENMLSPNYTEIGFAIEDGSLVGEGTTLVVEMFGKRQKDVVTEVAAGASDTQNITIEETVSAPIPVVTVVPRVASFTSKPLINSKEISFNLSGIILSLFIFTLVFDMIFIERKKIARVVGHNIDHVLYFGVLLIIIGILVQGVIL